MVENNSEEHLKSTEQIHSREERKATGRIVAVLIALFLIFLAVYHAWVRKTAILAGILVPALIMILYGGWVVFLAKRDKRRRLLMAKQAQENALKEIITQSGSAGYGTQENSDSSSVLNVSEKPISKNEKSKSRKDQHHDVLIHKANRWRGKSKLRYHFFKPNAQTEALIKSRKAGGIPLSRTCSAP